MSSKTRPPSLMFQNNIWLGTNLKEGVENKRTRKSYRVAHHRQNNLGYVCNTSVVAWRNANI